MVFAANSISLSAANYTSTNYGKMALPVDASALIYSHFEYVSGIAAPKGTHGIPINRLNLLDVLIGQLNQMKKAPSPGPLANPQGGLNSLIENLTTQIRLANSASTREPFNHSPHPKSGTLFNILS